MIFFSFHFCTCRFGWSFKDNEGMWQLQGLAVGGVSFGLHVSQLLEEAFQSNELDNILLKVGEHTYAYDLAGTMQTNTKVNQCPFFL